MIIKFLKSIPVDFLFVIFFAIIIGFTLGVISKFYNQRLDYLEKKLERINEEVLMIKSKVIE